MTGAPISALIVSRSVRTVWSTIPPNATLDEVRRARVSATPSTLRRLTVVLDALRITPTQKRSVN